MSGRLAQALRGVAALTAQEALSLALALLLMPYLMRVLGPAEFGRYAVGVATAGVLVMVVDFGFDRLGPMAVARAAAADRGRVFWEIQAAKGLLAVAALPLFALAAWASGLAQRYGDVLWAAGLGALGSLVLAPWFLLGLQRHRTQARSLATARLACACATLLAVHTPADAALAVWLQVAVLPAAGALSWLDGEVRRAAAWHAPAWRDVHRLLREGALLFASTAAIAMYTTCVPLVLGALSTPLAVGLFSAADKARIAGQVLLQPITSAALPRLAHWMQQHPADGLAAARQLMRLQVGLALAGSALIWVVAEPFMRWVAGPQFLPAVTATRVLGLCLPFTALTNALGVQILLPLGHRRAFAAILVGAAACGLAAAALLAPRWGDRGAALAVLGTEVLIVVLMALALKRRGVAVWRAA